MEEVVGEGSEEVKFVMGWKELVDEVRKMDLPLGKYAISGSGPVAIRGLREGRDLDSPLGFTPQLAAKTLS